MFNVSSVPPLSIAIPLAFSIFINAEEVCKPFGSTKFFNIILLGVAAGSGHMGLSRETLLKQIEQRVPSRFLDVNIQAFNAGMEIAGQAVR